MNVFVFDIETVPDVDGARRLMGLEGLEDAAVAEAMFTRRRQETGGTSDFLRLHMHRIVSIAGVLRSGDRFKVWSLGDEASEEKDLVQRFFDGLERYTPTLVSWNGGGFDLPVLNYRALLHGVAAPRYWDTGDDERDFRYNNYLSRFHWRHIDLMDVLAGFQPRAAAPLDEIATLLGFPGKLGMSGAKVWETYMAGELKAIRDYCETDVLNTYLVYLRFEVMRGNLTPGAYQEEIELVRSHLASEDKPHFAQFLAAWPEAAAV